ncbi:MAG: rRNA maturation RNase YbeY [Deltaproteobacteria bacterium]|nr:rRNA maturation RNase YbeY [Deltaproteobacteria bacterium]
MQITILDRQKKKKISKKKIQRWMKKLCLRRWGPKASRELGVVLVTDRTIHHLNKTFRFKDKPTDVLSFQNEDAFFSGPGDIVISVETAMAAAAQEGMPFDLKLKKLLVHGFLHLCGYDHERSVLEARRMQAVERAYLKLLNS